MKLPEKVRIIDLDALDAGGFIRGVLGKRPVSKAALAARRTG
jgi:hypothetical protein